MKVTVMQQCYEPTDKPDYGQVCHCCGGTYQFDLGAGQMWCINKRCSARGIRFTIPFIMKRATHKKEKE